MSARVLNPVVFTEFYKIRSPSSSSSLQKTIRKNFLNEKFQENKLKIDKIKKDLFGAVNPVETKKIFEDEIKKHQDLASKKWGFDFCNGRPLTVKSQFAWERLPCSDFIPTMYTLTRAAHVRQNENYDDILMNDEHELIDERSDRENANSNIENDDEFKIPSLHSVDNRILGSCSQLCVKRQPKITEYMKERKRLSSTPKKISPAKRLRSSIGSTSPSVKSVYWISKSPKNRH